MTVLQEAKVWGVVDETGYVRMEGLGYELTYVEGSNNSGAMKGDQIANNLFVDQRMCSNANCRAKVCHLFAMRAVGVDVYSARDRCQKALGFEC